MVRRHSAKTDANQAEIVRAFEAAGCSVKPLQAVGGGFPDLCVGFRGDNYLVEVKDGSNPPSRQKLRKSQEDFRRSWRGSMDVATSVDDVAALVKAWAVV